MRCSPVALRRFVGVSQGAIVALDAVASGRWKVGALIAFSGLLATLYP
jgi:phospholipase/carboxylesterase